MSRISESGIETFAIELLEKELGILLTDHNVHDTLAITNRAYILDYGKIEAHGTPKEILADEKAREIYLGTRFRINFPGDGEDEAKEDSEEEKEDEEEGERKE